MSTAKVTAVVTVWERVAPADLDEALASLAAQTRPADEVLIVEDGPLPAALHEVLDRYAGALPMGRLPLPANRGNGAARQAGLQEATHDLVAMVDADDLSLPERLAVQVAALERRGLDLIGAAVEEVDTGSGASLGFRRFPEHHDELVRAMRLRNPFNHPTVLLRRRAALKAGGYREVDLLEDYDLWARMVGVGAQLGNCPEVLVRFRGGTAMLGRRRSWAAARSEWTVQRSLHAAGLLSLWQMPVAWTVRNTFRLLPGGLLARAYRLIFLRRPR